LTGKLEENLKNKAHSLYEKSGGLITALKERGKQIQEEKYSRAVFAKLKEELSVRDTLLSHRLTLML
jgi:hypothetical protein